MQKYAFNTAYYIHQQRVIQPKTNQFWLNNGFGRPLFFCLITDKMHFLPFLKVEDEVDENDHKKTILKRAFRK